jgi:hypothetical protein
VAVLLSACGGDDTGVAEGGEAEPAAPTAGETTSTTLSPEDEVLADYAAAEAAVKVAYDPAGPASPGLLEHYAGAVLDRHQTTLSEYQAEGLSDVLRDGVLQVTNSTTRPPQAEPRTYVGLIEFDLERIDGTWKIVDVRTIEETC